jgi:D-glycero-alpha-D-manno-heptose-7-phosphate kinase
MKHLVARAPTRIDFGGGWTDVPPYSTEEGGFVCNVAIDLHAVVTVQAGTSPAGGGSDEVRREADRALVDAAIRRSGLRDVVVSLRSDFPAGAGLGGSSACGIALTGALDAWCGRQRSLENLAEESRRIEVEDLGVAGGRQDHYASAIGGALGLEFGQQTRVQRLPMDADFRRAVERRCLVVYTGQSRISGETITAVLDAWRNRDRHVLTALLRMKELAVEMAAAITARDLDALGALVGEHWVHQRALHPKIATPLIDEILEAARRGGALGGKALGASGGGCVLVVAPDDGVEPVLGAMRALAEPLEFRVDLHGFRLATGDRREAEPRPTPA